MNKQLIEIFKPGNIYALYFKNGKNIILKITDVNCRNGSVRGYDCFGIPTILCIHCIYAFRTLTAFPGLCSKVKKNREIQDVNVRHKSNKSFGEIPLENERVIEPDPLLDIKGEKAEDVDLIQAQKNGEIQDVNMRHKSNKSFSEIPVESKKVIEPDLLLDIKGEKTEDVDLIQAQKNPPGSIEYPNNNNRQPNLDLPNDIKHDSIIAKERNTLLSLKIISMNGNSFIEKSGGSSVN